MQNLNGTGMYSAWPLLPYKAPSGLRLAAFLIDYFIILIIVVLPAVLISFARIDANPEGMFVLFAAVMGAVFVVFGFKDIVKGRSIGKFMLGLAVRTRGDISQTPSAGKLFLRNVFSFLWPIELLFMVVLALMLAFIMFFGAIIFGTLAIIRNHPSYQAALSYIEAHPAITELVGDIEGFGSFPVGSVNTTGFGYGQAEFVIQVTGSNNTARVYIRLEREPLRDWEVVSFYYR